MKCPLFRIAAVIQPGGYAKDAFECLKEKCAWWDFERGCCCHKSIYLELDRLVAFIKEIANKMPHEVQFRK